MGVRRTSPRVVSTSRAVIPHGTVEVFPLTTNLFWNPSAEVDTFDWVALGDGTLDASTIGEFSGSKALRYVTEAQTDLIATDFLRPGITAGSQYTFSMYVSKTGANAVATVNIDWYKADSAFISTSSDDTDFFASDVTRQHFTATAPALAAKYMVRLTRPGSTMVTFYFDAFMLTEGSVLHEYFDGDTADSDIYTYAWTGTSHASTSTRTPL